MTSILHSPAQSRRTNSMGRAKSPCQDCRSASLQCDRARPMCFICISNGTACSGYKMDLRWQLGVASKGNLAGFSYSVPGAPTASSDINDKTASKKRRWRGKTSKITGDRHFKFVEGKSKGRQGRKAKTVSNSQLSNLNDNFREEIESEIESQDPKETFDASTSPPFLDLSCTDIDVVDLHAHSGILDESIEMVGSRQDQTFSNNEALYVPSLCGVENINEERRGLNNYSRILIPAKVHSVNIDQGYHEILSCYDQYICAIPLTADCFLNPFRVSDQTYLVSQHLLHAIMATSLFHLNRHNESSDSMSLVDSHRSESLGLYSLALGSPTWQDKAVAFLDTALLLMYLDSAQSALGLYHIHLEGVRSIIEGAGGGPALIPNNSKLRAELAMFIWYDATIALLAREELVLPLSYLESILRHGHSDGWSYIELTGCLEEFVVIMAKISSLAQQHETAKKKESLYFDIGAVDEVERTLRNVPAPYPCFNAEFDEETLDLLRDRYHCTEAWRNALLIYIERVFRWEVGEPIPSNAKYLARSIMDHARCIRRENNFQKQILLPLFLAGAEIRREEDRDFVRDYCSWWTRLCGSKMFIDASSFCEEIWEKTDTEDCRGVWWGSIIDKQCSESKLPARPQILLG